MRTAGLPDGVRQLLQLAGFAGETPNGNGARHCCQAPLRRAKDLPVFVTLIHEPEGPKTRPRSWRTSSGVVSHRGGPKTRFVVRFSSRESLAPQFPSAWPEGFRDLDVPRPFLGWVPSTRPVSLGGKLPSYKEAPALPAPLADWSGNPSAASSPRRTVQLRTSFHRLPAEIGPSVTRRTVLPLPAFWGGGDFRPDHELNLHKDSESRQAENAPRCLWITGISCTTRRNRNESPSRVPQSSESKLPLAIIRTSPVSKIPSPSTRSRISLGRPTNRPCRITISSPACASLCSTK